MPGSHESLLFAGVAAASWRRAGLGKSEEEDASPELRKIMRRRESRVGRRHGAQRLSRARV
jgi:hypothetical protein